MKQRDLICEADGKNTKGRAQCRDFSTAERAQRALKLGGILWLLAVIAVFVPILHFVLVPLLLIAGLVFGFSAWMDRGEILHGEFPCPVCGKTNVLAKQSASFPKTILCSHCYFTLQLK